MNLSCIRVCPREAAHQQQYAPGKMGCIPPVHTSDAPCTEVPAAPAAGNFEHLTPCGRVRREVSATFLSLRTLSFPSDKSRIKTFRRSCVCGRCGINSLHVVLGARMYFLSAHPSSFVFPPAAPWGHFNSTRKTEDKQCHHSNMNHSSPMIFCLAACPHLVLEKSLSDISHWRIFLQSNAISPCSEQAEQSTHRQQRLEVHRHGSILLPFGMDGQDSRRVWLRAGWWGEVPAGWAALGSRLPGGGLLQCGVRSRERKKSKGK